MNVKKFMVLTVLTIILSGCNTSNTKQEIVKNTKTVSSDAFEIQEFIMGTTISQRVYGDEAERVAGKVSDRLKELEKSMTINTAGGVINQLNDYAGKKQVKLTKDAVYVIEKAIGYAALSHGAFDITIGPLVKEWGIITEHPEVPKDEKIEELLKLVDYKKIDLDKEKDQVMLRDEGQVIDLGGIAKGFGGDEAIEIYKKEGI
ncbi:MAG: ApbE family lipoprotein, partial [Clostridia bacterium]|nr:ApbE family lipoprotein [Clostridia bacterium]